MTVGALPALALAQRAVQALPALYPDLARRGPPPQVVRIDSTGHALEGRGAARYIADGLCDAALLAAHPRFVFQTANGRIFRLLPDASSLSVEQGGAVGDGLANDQPAIQAAIDYAEATGTRELRFESELYRVDCPIRTSPLSATHAEDGHPMVVRRSLTLRGCAPGRTVFDFRAPNGADPETVWQTIPTSGGDATPTVWRGGGIFLNGETVRPDPAPRRLARLELHRLVLRGNRRHTGQYQWPANPATGDGWDISDKALWAQDCLVGDIICRDVDMIGWKGEIFHIAGVSDAVRRITLTRCRLLTSNGSAFNVGPNAEVLARDCEFGDCFQAQEDVAKTRATYRNCLWRDCDQMGLGSGPTADPAFNLLWPTRDDSGPVPQTILQDCEFRNITLLRIASWVRGSIRTIDTQLYLDGPTSMGLRDVDLSVEAWLDHKGSIQPAIVVGLDSLTTQVPGGPEGLFMKAPSQIRLRVRKYRTALAVEQNRRWGAMSWSGLIDRGCRFSVEGEYGAGNTPNGGANPRSMPLVEWHGGQCDNPYTPHGSYAMPPLSGTATLIPTSPQMAIAANGEENVELTLARYPTGGEAHGYAGGQKVRLFKSSDNGTIHFVQHPVPAPQMVMGNRVLTKAYDWIEFAYNRDRAQWEECGFFSAV